MASDWADEKAREIASARRYQLTPVQLATLVMDIAAALRIPGDCVRLADGRVVEQESIRGGCFFCQDRDAVRCPHGIETILKHIAEGSGKRAWWNVHHYVIELASEVMAQLRKDINSTREAAEAARGEGST